MTRHVNVPLSNDLYEQIRRRAAQLDKDVGQLPAEHVTATFPLETAAETDPVERERAAYRRLHPTLHDRYRGQFVAIHGQQLVDHDADKMALVARIDERYPDRFVLIRRVQTDPEPVYRRIGVRWADHP